MMRGQQQQPQYQLQQSEFMLEQQQQSGLMINNYKQSAEVMPENNDLRRRILQKGNN